MKGSHVVVGLFGIALMGITISVAFGQDLPGPDQAEIEKFLNSKGYKDEAWSSPAKDGLNVEGKNYPYHGFMKVFYSAGIEQWLRGEPSKKPRGLGDNEMIVSLEYAPPNGKPGEPGELQRINSMVRWNGSQEQHGPYDGWFWSVSNVEPGSGPDDWKIDPSRSEGAFGMGRCLTCHAASDNESMVFLGSGPLEDGRTSGANDLEWKEPEPGNIMRERIAHLPDDDIEPSDDNKEYFEKIEEFIAYYELQPATRKDFEPFPARENDHVYAHYHAVEFKNHQQFVTSDQCLGCHNAWQLIPGTRPNMLYPEPEPGKNLLEDNPDALANRNFSPYGEWGASLNGLSGRDPVWHAQVAFERDLRPELANFTDGACFSCHGPMATRQLATDLSGEGFRIDMFYATGESKYAKYGALARDGVSCAVCHQISAKNLGVDPAFDPDNPPGKHITPDDLNSYTALFTVEPDAAKNAYWGPYKAGRLTETRVSSLVMDKSLGQRARYGPLDDNGMAQIQESKLCGSCHTVIVPALPVGYKMPENERGDPKYKDPFHDPDVPLSFEQTTYFEWRNSQYENEVNTENPNAITCQGCHMAYHTKAMMEDGEGRRIVNTLSNRYPPVDGRVQDPAITYTTKDPIYRHVLLGINYFVFEMYEQFDDLLVGTQADDPRGPRVPNETVDPMINARDWIENHAKKITAEVRITDIDLNKVIDGEEFLEVEVEVTNLAGHKFPTGAGFRRAFLKFEVLGESGDRLWVSGRFDDLGVLLDGDGNVLDSEETHTPHKSQPHHQIITRQDQVQIYETRALDSNVQLQTTVLGIYYEYKDNRILPLGYTPPTEHDIVSQKATGSALVGDPDKQPPGVQRAPKDAPEEATHHPTTLDDGTKPFEVVYDADYWSDEAKNGQDHIRYRVPLAAIDGWKRVRAQLYYQTIPPYYLQDRFAALSPAAREEACKETNKETDVETPCPQLSPRNKSDLKRLVYMTSHLNLTEGALTDNWSLRIGVAAEIERMTDEDGKDVVTPDEYFGQQDANRRLKEHYTYLNLP